MEPLLIETLADGLFHSGQHLGELLGVSRTAVWKHLQKLADLGIEIESVKGKGYRIPGGLELLREDAIRASLADSVSDSISNIHVQQMVDSTNAYVASLGEDGNGVICLAEYQSLGRGRRGRNWSSPFGRNIYLSLGWQFDGGAACLEGLSLAVGVAVLRALDRHESLGLKWPNDVLFNGRKVAGILLEMQGDPSGRCQVVVGIGINQGMSGQRRPEIDQPWADASDVGSWSRNTLVAKVLNELLPVVDSFAQKGFSHYADEWNGFDISRDLPVRLITPAMEVHGIARGVTESGAVKIEVDGSLQIFNGGELSLRLVK